MVLRVGFVVLVLALALPIAPAHAQGFWQFLFGQGRPAPPPPRLPPPPANAFADPAPGSPYRSPYAWPLPGPFSPYEPGRRGYGEAVEQAGAFRTLCVRLCDGFYFPISNAAAGSGLGRDADRCTASCGVEARLFYYPNAGGDVETMTDLTGLAYTALPNAFKYRNTLVEGCRCRPQPWSETELARHRAYARGWSPSTEVGTAAKAQAKKEDLELSVPPGSQQARSNATVPVPIDRATLEALDLPQPTIADAEQGIARPQPVLRRAQPGWPDFDSGPSTPARSKYTWPGMGR